MPIATNNEQLPPLRTTFTIDVEPLRELRSAFETIDRTLPNIDNRLQSIMGTLNELVNLSAQFRDNLSVNPNINVGAGQALTPVGRTSFPIRGGTQDRPLHVDPNESFFERATRYREFVYGSTFHGYGTLLAAGAFGLAGGGGIGASLTSAYGLPTNLQTAADYGKILQDLDIEINTEPITDAVKTGIVEGFDLLLGEGSFDRASHIMEGLNVLPRIGFESLTGSGGLPAGTFSALTTGSSSFPHGFTAGTLIEGLLRATFVSEGDKEFAQRYFGSDSPESNIAASYLRAPFSTLGNTALGEQFKRVKALGGLFFNRFANYLYPPAEAATLTDIDSITTGEIGDIAPVTIRGRQRRRIGNFLSFNEDVLNPDITQYTGNITGTGRDFLQRYVLGAGNDLNSITNLQDLQSALEGGRLSQVLGSVGDLSRGEVFRGFDVVAGPEGVGDLLGNLDQLELKLRDIGNVIDPDNPAAKFFSDLSDDTGTLIDEMEKLTINTLGFFDRLEVNAERANVQFEGLEQTADSIGDAFAGAFGQVALEGQNLKDVMISLITEIRNQLFQLLIGQTISSLVSSGISAAFGGLGITRPTSASGGFLTKNMYGNYRVNEQGPEYLVNAVSSGRYKDTLEQINEGTFGMGESTNVTINIAPGVDRQQLAQSLQALENLIDNKVVKGSRAPFNAYRNAFQGG